MRARSNHALAAIVLGTALSIGVVDTAAADASTVIGANAMLSDGAAALMNGDWERGVQLTQMGLSTALSENDRAAAYANLCAGYAAMRQYERALENCNQSIALDEGNWRAWQNRAAAHLGLGQIEESIRDIQRGLQINPESEDLQKTLAIARGYEKLKEERVRHLLES
jgi:DnaJ homolog subfamily C member 7